MADELEQTAEAAQPAAPTSTPTPSGVHVMSPDGQLGTIDPAELQDAINNGYTQATPQDLAQAQYGGAGQQALAGLEGAAEGATFGLSTGAEKWLGVPSEDIRGRREANPITNQVGQVAGLAASSLIPVAGEANILKAAGEGAAEAIGAKAGGTFLSQVTNDTVKAAFETSLFQGGDEIAKMYADDPNQSAETAISDMGMAAVMGGVFGGGVGAMMRGAAKVPELLPKFVSGADRAAVESGDFTASITHADNLNETQKAGILSSLSKEKANAGEIRSAAKILGDAPVLEGMVSDSPWVQKGEDALIGGAPTVSGIARKQLYDNAYNIAKNAVDQAAGEGSKLSKAELGNTIKKNITDQLEGLKDHFEQAYSGIAEHYPNIPVSEEAASALKDELSSMKEIRLAPDLPGSKLAKQAVGALDNVKTADDLKVVKSALKNSLGVASSPEEKRMAAIIADKFGQLEEASVDSYAKSFPRNDEARSLMEDLIRQRKDANGQYKVAMDKLGTLSEQLGKGKLHGIQDAITFINERLTPEEVAGRLFSKNNSEFLQFFQKEFPNEMNMLRDYQKGLLREKSVVARTGEWEPREFLKRTIGKNGLEPEVKKILFTPQELKKMEAANTYLQSFPKSFNPSGTAHTSAFREFFEHPTGAIIGNARDYAIEKFVKYANKAPEIAHAQSMAKATVSGYKTAQRAIKAAVDGKVAFPAGITASVAARNALSRTVEDLAKNPHKMLAMNDSNPVPSYSQPLSAASARAHQYLQSNKPDESRKSPLDAKPTASPSEKAAYNRKLDLVQQPLLILKHLKEGTITPSDLGAIKAVYPHLTSQLQRQMLDAVTDAVQKGKTIPYQTRLGLSMFLGQNMDSTMTPQSILSAQPSPQPNQEPQYQPGAENGRKGSTKALGKAPKTYMTPSQLRDADRAHRGD